MSTEKLQADIDLAKHDKDWGLNPTIPLAALDIFRALLDEHEETRRCVATGDGGGYQKFWGADELTQRYGESE